MTMQRQASDVHVADGIGVSLWAIESLEQAPRQPRRHVDSSARAMLKAEAWSVRNGTEITVSLGFPMEADD